MVDGALSIAPRSGQASPSQQNFSERVAPNNTAYRSATSLCTPFCEEFGVFGDGCGRRVQWPFAVPPHLVFWQKFWSFFRNRQFLDRKPSTRRRRRAPRLALLSTSCRGVKCVIHHFQAFHLPGMLRVAIKLTHIEPSSSVV
jgi:hypothetical protein